MCQLVHEIMLALDLSYIHQYPYYYCRTPLMNERIKVLHRAEVINAMLDILYNSEHRIDSCGNSRFPSLIFSFESIRGAIMSVKNRKKYTRQRYIFEITQQNIQYCKNLMKIAEIHHMNEIEANFLLNEKEYLGSITLKEPHQQAIYSNVREIVQQIYIHNDYRSNLALGCRIHISF